MHTFICSFKFFFFSDYSPRYKRNRWVFSLRRKICWLSALLLSVGSSFALQIVHLNMLAYISPHGILIYFLPMFEWQCLNNVTLWNGGLVVMHLQLPSAFMSTATTHSWCSAQSIRQTREQSGEHTVVEQVATKESHMSLSRELKLVLIWTYILQLQMNDNVSPKRLHV